MNDLIIEKHSDYESLNKSLLKEIELIPYDMTNETHLKAKMSEWSVDSPGISVIRDWAISLTGAEDIRFVESHDNGKRLCYCGDCWYARYDKGDYAEEHDHGKKSISFVYYVNTPVGSSPLYFSEYDTTVDAEEGNIVMFPGNVKHSVPPNNCDNRVIVAGNLSIMNINI